MAQKKAEPIAAFETTFSRIFEPIFELIGKH